MRSPHKIGLLPGQKGQTSFASKTGCATLAAKPGLRWLREPADWKVFRVHSIPFRDPSCIAGRERLHTMASDTMRFQNAAEKL